MGRRFLDNVYEGKNDWWRYVVVLGVSVYYWLFWSYYVYVASSAVLSELPIPPVAAATISQNMHFLIELGLLILLLWGMNERSWRSLITAEPAVNIKRIAQGFGVWGGLMLTSQAIGVWSEPQNYAWNFQPSQWIVLLMLSLLFVPIQTSAEELLFRGYLIQAMRLLTHRSFILIVMSAFLFAIPHFGNPEMQRGAFVWGAANYFTWGVIFAAVTIKDNGLELSLGMHAAHNIIGSVVVTTPDSVIQSPALLTYVGPLDPRHGLVWLLYEGFFFYCIFFGGVPRKKQVKRKD